MRIRATLLMVTLLGACQSGAPSRPASAAAAGVVGAEADGGSGTPSRQPAFSTAVLPSMASTGVLKADTPLLQRPTSSSVILNTLAAGETVQVLGPLDNADGQWLSVSVGEVQGWIRAAQIKP